MSQPLPELPLVYSQDERFVPSVGEPLPLHQVSRVGVAKWDALYGDALRAACLRVFPVADVAVWRSGGAVLEALRHRPVDLVLLGLTFPDLDGLDVLQGIENERLARRVVVISSRRDENSLQALRSARFDGLFDPLEEDIDALIAALQQVASGRGYVSPSLSKRMFAQRSGGVLTPRLTPVELQVLSVIGDGSDNAEAAARLGLRESTVATHRRNLMRKLDVSTSAKLVREAVRLGVVRITASGEIVRRQSTAPPPAPDGHAPRP